MDWSRKWLVDFNTRKTKLVSFDWSNNNGATDVKREILVHHQMLLLIKMLGLTFSFKVEDTTINLPL